ncbi:hypothetical protein V8C34DRAFT_221208 [Trichoderma compactum]
MQGASCICECGSAVGLPSGLRRGRQTRTHTERPMTSLHVNLRGLLSGGSRGWLCPCTRTTRTDANSDMDLCFLDQTNRGANTTELAAGTQHVQARCRQQPTILNAKEALPGDAAAGTAITFGTCHRLRLETCSSRGLGWAGPGWADFCSSSRWTRKGRYQKGAVMCKRTSMYEYLVLVRVYGIQDRQHGGQALIISLAAELHVCNNQSLIEQPPLKTWLYRARSACAALTEAAKL